MVTQTTPGKGKFVNYSNPQLLNEKVFIPHSLAVQLFQGVLLYIGHPAPNNNKSTTTMAD